MIYFITGGSASGKSQYAEDVARQIAEKCQNGSKVIYLATMKDGSESSKKKIERHKKMRSSYRHETVECFDCQTLHEVAHSPAMIGQRKDVSENKNDVILFDCLSNFIADVMFSEDVSAEQSLCIEDDESDKDHIKKTLCNDGRMDEEINVEKNQEDGIIVSVEKLEKMEADIVRGIQEICTVFENVIIVGDLIFSDGQAYDEITEAYIRLSGNVYCKTAELADAVTEVVCGVPVSVKGEDYEVLKINRNNFINVY